MGIYDNIFDRYDLFVLFLGYVASVYLYLFQAENI